MRAVTSSTSEGQRGEQTLLYKALLLISLLFYQGLNFLSRDLGTGLKPDSPWQGILAGRCLAAFFVFSRKTRIASSELRGISCRAVRDEQKQSVEFVEVHYVSVIAIFSCVKEAWPVCVHQPINSFGSDT